MAEWKKVIVSGSNATIASLQVDNLKSGVVTGSANGTLGIVPLNGSGSILTTTGATGVSISGSFSGSFFGNGGGLTNISASSIVGLNLSQITTGSITASVNIGTNTFTVASQSIQLFNVNSNGGVKHGVNVTASGDYSHAEGTTTTSTGSYSHAEGNSTTALGIASHAEGVNTISSGHFSHAEGRSTVSIGAWSHAEGYYTTSSGTYSHAEGFSTLASGSFSHAEGYSVTASADYSHAEGYYTIASGTYSHAEGRSTISSGSYSHAEGQYTTASGDYSHAEGIGTNAAGTGQNASGTWNTLANTTSLFVIGNGSGPSTRSDLALFNSQSITFNQPVTASIFSGSFYGTFSGSSNLPDLTQSTGIAPFIYDGSGTATVAVSGAAALSNNTIVKWNSADGKFVTSSITDNGNLVTFSKATVFQGDVTVEGTASFQNTQNLLVADRFVLFGSGSTTPGDGGIVVQQGLTNIGELFGYENSAARWGFTSSFNATSTSYTPAAFVAAVIDIANGQVDVAEYQKNGNIKIDSGDIWIYA